MANFKLTIKAPDDSELDSNFVKAIMKRLRDYGLLDEDELCNMTVADFLESDRLLRRLTGEVNRVDWPSQIRKVGELILVGENRKGDNCPNCGHPEYYYTGGRMLCNQCEHSGDADDPIYEDGDITDYSGRVVI